MTACVPRQGFAGERRGAMNRRQMLRAAAFGAAWATLGRLRPELDGAVPDGGRRPNIVLILADDLGSADLSCLGCKDVPTPQIDSLAANGIRLTQGYVSAPLCSPTRAGLMTGRYQQRFGWEFNPDRGDPGISRDEKTLADYLRKSGYATGLVGKWHLGYAQPYLPLQRGFDEFFGFTYAMNPYGGDGKTTKVFRGNEEVEEKEYLTDAFTREAVDFLGRHKDQPFFLYLAYNAVHAPMETSPRHKDKFAEIADPKRRTFATMLTAMDEGVGQVLKKLRDERIEDDTLIVFLSDNGGHPPVNTSRNDPLSGGKGMVAEGGIRVPFMVQWKGKLPAGKVYEPPAIALDILPTALAVAGVEPPADGRIEGVNLLPHLSGKVGERPHPYLYWRMGGQWAVRGGDWKLRCDGKDADARLFDLSGDIAEKTDLSKEQPAKARELKDAWDQWNARNIRPVKVPASSRQPSSKSQPAAPAQPVK
jgi:arylsulfatase A-like enzyme